ECPCELGEQHQPVAALGDVGRAAEPLLGARRVVEVPQLVGVRHGPHAAGRGALSTFRGAAVSLPLVTGTELTFSEFMAARWTPFSRTASLLPGARQGAGELLQWALARPCVRWSSIREKGAAAAYVPRAMAHQMASRWRRPRRELATA